MASIFMANIPYHKGEEEIQNILKVPRAENPSVPTLSPQLSNHLQIAPLIALGTVDKEGRPWTTLWGNGDKGFARPLTNEVIGIRTPVASRYDPVVEELVGKEATGEVIQETGKGRMVSGLTLDLETRKRVKLYGRMVAGAFSAREDELTDTAEHVAEVQLVLKIEQSLGNCPKYINKKKIVAATSNPTLVSDSAQLPPQAVELVEKSDLFFLSSAKHDEDMDTNHRGGPPGFMRVLSNDLSGAVLVYPEYSGNRLYQTLGNLRINPLVGISIPDFDTGDMLYCTGKTEILVGKDASDLLPRSNLIVKTTITSARFVAGALPFRGVPGDRSPYNPTVRYLTSEKAPALSQAQQMQQATLLRQTKLTPTISRFRFAMENPVSFTAGQYVTFDFSQHLDLGYSHMRDDDPRSLNDDFVRTFTVSNPPADTTPGATNTPIDPSRGTKPDEFEITIRRVGTVTDFLFGQKGREQLGSDRHPVEVGVMGFGGEFEVVQQQGANDTIYFIAAGVGITPLLPSLYRLDFDRLKVFWSVRKADVPLVVDILAEHPSLKRSLVIFVTDGKEGAEDKEIQALNDSGPAVCLRRMTKPDIIDPEGGTTDRVSTYYLCTSVPMRKQIMEWLPKEKLVFEDFNF